MKFIELINQSNFLKKRLENIDDIFKNSLVEGIKEYTAVFTGS